PRCLTSPYDDGKFHRSGSAHRFRVRGSIDLRVTELPDLRSSMWLPSVTGREVWVLATNVSSCPHVWWGGHQVMRNQCTMATSSAGAGYGWFRVRTRAPHHGRLVIKTDAKIDSIRVDAVAVLR